MSMTHLDLLVKADASLQTAEKLVRFERNEETRPRIRLRMALTAISEVEDLVKAHSRFPSVPVTANVSLPGELRPLKTRIGELRQQLVANRPIDDDEFNSTLRSVAIEIKALCSTIQGKVDQLKSDQGPSPAPGREVRSAVRILRGKDMKDIGDMVKKAEQLNKHPTVDPRLDITRDNVDIERQLKLVVDRYDHFKSQIPKAISDYEVLKAPVFFTLELATDRGKVKVKKGVLPKPSTKHDQIKHWEITPEWKAIKKTSHMLVAMPPGYVLEEEFVIALGESQNWEGQVKEIIEALKTRFNVRFHVVGKPFRYSGSSALFIWIVDEDRLRYWGQFKPSYVNFPFGQATRSKVPTEITKKEATEERRARMDMRQQREELERRLKEAMPAELKAKHDFAVKLEELGEIQKKIDRRWKTVEERDLKTGQMVTHTVDQEYTESVKSRRATLRKRVNEINKLIEITQKQLADQLRKELEE